MKKIATNMYSYQVIALFVLIGTVKSFPSDLNDLSAKNGASEELNSDYDEKMADIFDIPLNDDQQVNLENCENIICMPHYLCINDMVVNNGTELFEWRISTRMTVDKSDIVCKSMEMPCCADEAIENLHQNSTDDQSESSESRNNDSSSEIQKPNSDEDQHTDAPNKEEDYDVNEIEDEKPIQNVFKCGYRKSRHTSARIVDGDEAEPNEYPWMVGLFLRLPSGNLRFIGGGSLIHGSVIMTAAHSLRRIVPENLIIRAGEHDILDTHNDKNRQERSVKNIIIHEDLYAEALINDIALVVLDKPFELSETVNTICLPPQSVQTDEHVMCTVSGWGKNAGDRGGKYQATLRKVDLSIVKRGKCERYLRKTRLGPFYNLNESLMCAGGGRRDTCKGDGGSPLVCVIPYDKNRFYQTGIVAGGIGCGANVPGLYVNVAHFSHWITHQLGFINLNLEQENILPYDLFD